MTVEEMLLSGKYSLDDIKDKGHLFYLESSLYHHVNMWFMIDIDLSGLEGKPQWINISLPDTLIQRIDEKVKDNPTYKDRSHFLAIAARHELSHKDI